MKLFLNILRTGVVLTVLSFTFIGGSTFAAPRPNATDWYIEDFKTDITVKQDGGLDIVEDILADCGQCSDRHGIFRIVPERVKTKEGNVYSTPVTLNDITDEQGNTYPYSESQSTKDGTVTWKIGDADTTVTGEHHYIINYSVDRVVRDQKQFDELYWNLVGGFWTLEMDHVNATIHLPSNLFQKDIQLYTYAGPQGKNGDPKEWMTSQWVDDHTLTLESIQTFPQKHDMTVSMSFPKGLITSATASSQDKLVGIEAIFFALLYYGVFLLPLAVLIVCFLYWRKYGKDPKSNKTIIAEYEAPDKLSPLMMRLLQTYGKLDKQGITAAIVDLAIHNVLIIKETKPAAFLSAAQFNLQKRPESEWKRTLSKTERAFVNGLFHLGDDVSVNSLKLSFYKQVPEIQKIAEQDLTDLGYIDPGKGKKLAGILAGVSVVMGFIGYYLIGLVTTFGLSLIVSAIIMFLFGLVMKRPTLKGAEVLWKIKGFKLFMETVEKYRQQWNEKQNFFEEMLPYAIAFDMTKRWISKMNDIGAVPAANYAPAWYVGTQAFTSFDALTTQISSMSSEIGSHVTTSSGSSGGGFSGGGGGGGGGGGW